MFDFPARQKLQILHQHRGFAAAVGFDHADHHIQSLRTQAPRFQQHRVGLADPGRGTEEDFELAARASCSAFWTRASNSSGLGRRSSWVMYKFMRSGPLLSGAIEREVEREHIDARLAEDTQPRTLGVLLDQRLYLLDR